MKCPQCRDRDIAVEPCEGYAQDLRVCRVCGCTWSWVKNHRIVIRNGVIPVNKN